MIYYNGETITSVTRKSDLKEFKLGDNLSIGKIELFKVINKKILVTVNGRDHLLENLEIKKNIWDSVFKTFLDQFEDMIIMVKKTGYHDESYHVVTESAYEEVSYKLMSKDEIKKIYKIDLDNE